MPGGYAHFKFGQEVLKRLPNETSQIINQHRGLFDIGVHGPDILFFYNALYSNPVSKLGFALHDKTGEEFFTVAKTVLQKHMDSPAHFAYIYGVLCHFALDATCHGCVEYFIHKSGICHTIIENEFDRNLMEADGKDAVSTSLVKHLKPTKHHGEVMHVFYPPVTAKEAKKAIGDSVFYNGLMLAPNKLDRNFKFFLLKLVGQYEKRLEHFMGYHKEEKCEESNQALLELFNKAIETAVILITEYMDFVKEDGPLHPIYNYTFAGIDYDKNGLLFEEKEYKTI